jgi:hypothetical protein
MVYMSIGNHSTDARNCQAGKTVIGIIKVPPRRTSDALSDSGGKYAT